MCCECQIVLNSKPKGGYRKCEWWMSQRKSERAQEGMKDREKRQVMTFTLSVREESTRQSGNSLTLNHSAGVNSGCKVAHTNKPLILTILLTATHS